MKEKCSIHVIHAKIGIRVRPKMNFVVNEKG